VETGHLRPQLLDRLAVLRRRLERALLRLPILLRGVAPGLRFVGSLLRRLGGGESGSRGAARAAASILACARLTAFASCRNAARLASTWRSSWVLACRPRARTSAACVSFRRCRDSASDSTIRACSALRLAKAAGSIPAYSSDRSFCSASTVTLSSAARRCARSRIRS
jgi:hypothetical protein